MDIRDKRQLAGGPTALPKPLTPDPTTEQPSGGRMVAGDPQASSEHGYVHSDSVR